MRVYVVGAGAVGTYLGQTLREQAGATVVYAPRALADVVPFAADLVIVAVKAYDTPGAVETVRRALGAAAGVKDLARRFPTLDALKAAPEMQTWIRWIAKRRPVRPRDAVCC